ncbi:MAG: NAD(P)-dependent oxidoreductase [Deltaproteobacteria bacterium]|nr:NAD(P)-dependent oxidoreductase [Deltaproteobacteria bacterium]
MNKLLVTGAGGFLGSAVCQAASAMWQVYGVVFSHAAPLNPHAVFRADLTRQQEVRRVMDAVLPHAVIHTAAMADPNICQTHPAQSRKINVDAAVFIARWCADHDIPMVFTSSDLVFDGRNAPYRESDPVNPVSLYGEQKVRAEAEILRVHPEAAVCRMSLMFGDKPSARYQPPAILLKQGQKIRLFVDEVRTPLDVYTAAEGILLALGKSSGLLHLGGAERISRYQFGRLLAEVLNIASDAIEPCLQKDIPMAAPRPADVSLNIEVARGLGFAPPLLSEILHRLYP